MSLPNLWIFALAGLVSACMLGGETNFPPGAKAHGPYLDRTYQDFVVRAVHVEDITIVSVQRGTEPPEPTPEHYAQGRQTLAGGFSFALGSQGEIPVDAADYEAAALKAAEVPGWCPYESQFAYLAPLEDSPQPGFKIRGTYSDAALAFMFAGQCR